MRLLIVIGVAAGVAAAAPILYERLQPFAPERAEARAPDAAPVEVAKARAPLSGRKALIEADETGHFRSQFRFNGHRIEGMIDTGATVVAMNASTARRIGLNIPDSSFRHQVTTANGKTRAASVTIDAIEIGRIRIEDVEALVLDDKALAATLVGLSALKRLSRYRVERGTLLLEQ